MADVFISYAREDRQRVQSLVDALESEGLSVWWDTDLVPGGRYRQSIADELAAASAVIVAWTGHSLQSDWVQDEAEEGRQRGVLVPVLLEPVRPPAGFRQLQSADLGAWDGSASHPEFSALLRALRRLAAEPVARLSAAPAPPAAIAGNAKPLPPAARPLRLGPLVSKDGWRTIGLLVVLALVALGLISNYLDDPRPQLGSSASMALPGGAQSLEPQASDSAGRLDEPQVSAGLPSTAHPGPAPSAPAEALASPSGPSERFMVFFDLEQDKVTPPAGAILAHVADYVRRYAPSQVLVTGHTDRGEDPEIGAQRARAVMSALAARGTPQHLLKGQTVGADDPLVLTGPGVREAQNRRVTIQVTF